MYESRFINYDSDMTFNPVESNHNNVAKLGTVGLDKIAFIRNDQGLDSCPGRGRVTLIIISQIDIEMIEIKLFNQVKAIIFVIVFANIFRQ